MASNNSPVYLITAASGHIGSHLIPVLLSQQPKPTLVLPTRNPDRLNSQLGTNANDTHVKIIHGDIEDPAFVETLVTENGITAAFLCLIGENELMVTLNIFDALKHGETVKHIVYLSACSDFDLEPIRAGKLGQMWAGHVLVKPIIEAKLRYGLPPRSQPGGFSWTILGPSLFFTNDLRSKKRMLDQGLFDEPLGSKGVSRVDPADIALAAANALQDDGKLWSGKKIMIGSLETYTNEKVAKLWSEATQTKVSFLASDRSGLETFEKNHTPVVGKIWARDMRLMYEYFEAEGFGMTDEEYLDQVELLGRAPASYEDFVKSTGKGWRTSSAE
ncbi:hypothetical protein FSARC_452 [Fusarium sarcochroum]|uniref:NmrA-like domain-containing protein n=1 Tax=Fusarium sarcochroum TaxID=1208366 RepID=A0A8H4UB70_9HYPO|nr:hypothetical protein FSARC_452 [Fusarium sarcochroum]